ncbi:MULTISPECIES: electron transfer flavoprotein subunit alpha/FixB family protein [unclassified Microbulbifer]|uniref:electron transfer flavoprotein subunit alpha n=1 Tax=unclassified Microbulbifer TaxID=2619833 RepID=UPI0027E46AA1|nr:MULTISPECIES: electron transfer flavoprotein subunit alpha/FixB family protein [unclassified Microbulbifer]
MSDVIRRDPRTERILRNRLHPLHESLAGGPVRGPTGLLRRNPHAVGFIGPNGLKRIDRSSTGPAPSGRDLGRSAKATHSEEQALPLHRVDHPDFYVAAVLDMAGGRLTSHDRDVLGQAQQLAHSGGGQGAVVAIVLGEARETGFDTAGADRLIQVTHCDGQALDDYCPERKLAVLQAVEDQLGPRFWLFPDSVHGGADLGSRLAVRLGERPAVHAWQVSETETLCRGGSGRIDIRRHTPRVLLLAEECALPVDDSRHQALPIQLDEYPDVRVCIRDQGLVPVDPSQIPLAEAEFILSAGNGVRDWDQFHEVATALGATEGASRVAVDDGFMPRFRQIGATGTWVTARVYVAVGISGAVQHLQGIGRCEKVVAINLDDGCDMVRRADLSAIGDSSEILAELLALVREHRGGKDTDATVPETLEVA